MDDYLYNPFYNKTNTSNVNKTNTSNVKKSKTSNVKKSKIKWQQIIILLLILAAITVIIYFITNSFKKKCPDPDKPVYNTIYKKCIPACDPITEIYNDTTEECELIKICSEDPEKPVQYPSENPNDLCSGQIKYCICGPQCIGNEYFDTTTLECECQADRCGDGTCCKNNTDCILQNDGNYFCCDPEQVYNDENGYPIGCCGPYSKPNESKNGCLPQCGPITQQGISNYRNFKNKNININSSEDGICEDGICSVAIFDNEGIADDFIKELDNDTYRGIDVIFDDDGNYEVRVYYCFNNKNGCQWDDDSTNFIPSRVEQIPLLYTNKIDTDGPFSIDKFSSLGPIDSEDNINFYNDFYNSNPIGLGNYCALEGDSDSYRRMKRTKGNNLCGVSDCLDQLGKFKGAIRVQTQLVDDGESRMCTGIYGPNNNQTGLKTATICYGVKDPIPECKQSGDIIFDEQRNEENNDTFKSCEGDVTSKCPLQDDDLKTCSLNATIVNIDDSGFDEKYFQDILNNSDIYPPISKLQNREFNVGDTLSDSEDEKYKLILSDNRKCENNDAICKDIPNYKMYRRGSASWGPAKTIRKKSKGNCNGKYGCKMFATTNTSDYFTTYLNFGKYKLKVNKRPTYDNVSGDLAPIMDNISSHPRVVSQVNPVNGYNFVNNQNITTSIYTGEGDIELDENNFEIVNNNRGRVTFLTLVNLIFYYVNVLHYSADVMATRSWAYRYSGDDGGPEEAGGWGQMRWMSPANGTDEVWKTNFIEPGSETKDDRFAPTPIYFENMTEILGYAPQQYNTALLVDIINKEFSIKIESILDKPISSPSIVNYTLNLIDDYLSSNIIGNSKYPNIEKIYPFLKYTTYNRGSITNSGIKGYGAIMLIPFLSAFSTANRMGIEIAGGDNPHQLFSQRSYINDKLFKYNGDDGKSDNATLLEFEPCISDECQVQPTPIPTN